MNRLQAAEKRYANLKMLWEREKEENRQLREALTQALGSETSDDCYHDHHGYCQAHRLEPVDRCWVLIAEVTLAATKEE